MHSCHPVSFTTYQNLRDSLFLSLTIGVEEQQKPKSFITEGCLGLYRGCSTSQGGWWAITTPAARVASICCLLSGLASWKGGFHFHNLVYRDRQNYVGLVAGYEIVHTWPLYLCFCRDCVIYRKTVFSYVMCNPLHLSQVGPVTCS